MFPVVCRIQPILLVEVHCIKNVEFVTKVQRSITDGRVKCGLPLARLILSRLPEYLVSRRLETRFTDETGRGNERIGHRRYGLAGCRPHASKFSGDLIIAGTRLNQVDACALLNPELRSLRQSLKQQPSRLL